jgi:hypothetical protein
MRNRAATVILIVIGAMIALAVNVTLFAAVVTYRAYRQGTAVVQVQEKGPDGVNLWIPVPVSLAGAAMRFIPKQDLPPVDPEVAAALPTLQEIARELDRMPDAVLVEVESADEWVRISKKDGRLVVEVDDPDARVHVSLPPGALGEIVSHLGWLVRQAPPAPPAPPLPAIPPAAPAPAGSV